MIKFLNYRYGLALLLCLPAWATTPTSPILETKPETLLTAPPLTAPIFSSVQTNSATPPKETNALYLQNFDELIAHPQILQHLLDKAVGEGDMGLVGQLLPVYQRAIEQKLLSDNVLLEYATALYARSQGEFGHAIDILTNLSKQNPAHKPILLQLAITQWADKRYHSAQESFAQVRADPDLPEEIGVQINHYQRQIKDNYFDINVGFRYLNDKNVNNAPKQSSYGNWQLPTAQSAQGIGYSLGGSGKVPIFDQIALSYSLLGFGKYYWDNKDYNDHTTRLMLGGVYETGRQSFAISPMASVRQFANESYSKSTGIEFRHSQVVNPKLNANHTLQINKVKHDSRKHLDGTDVAVSGTWVRGLGLPYRYAYGGYDVAYDNAKDDSDKSIQAGVRLGLGWQMGKLVVDGSLGVHRRQYQGEDFFAIKRHDTIYNADVALSKADWQYQGFVPKLVLSYEKTASNHFMYNNDNHQIYMIVQKMY